MSSRKAEQEQLHRIRRILATLSRKGFLEVLWHLNETGEARFFNDIRRYALESKIIESRGTITIILNELTKLGLLERKVITDATPIRTSYAVSEEGKTILDYLQRIEKQLG